MITTVPRLMVERLFGCIRVTLVFFFSTYLRHLTWIHGISRIKEKIEWPARYSIVDMVAEMRLSRDLLTFF